jgi:rhamnosyltransferase
MYAAPRETRLVDSFSVGCVRPDRGPSEKIWFQILKNSSAFYAGFRIGQITGLIVHLNEGMDSEKKVQSAWRVCAVMVTYHPSPAIIANLPKVLAQVDGLVVIDNGSAQDEILGLRSSQQHLGFDLIENGENVGIAEALNQGVRWAKNEAYSWVILLDQDSQLTDHFVAKMFATWEVHPQRERIGSIHPTYVDPETGRGPKIRRAPDGGPVVSLTSGALMPMWVFDEVGLFSSTYFIDYVDHEYCLRVRAAGYLIADSKVAMLLHSAGHPRGNSFCGFKFRPTHHSVTRRYYISRNRIATYRAYFAVFPGWIGRIMYDDLRETVKCFLGEKDRRRKARSFLRGTWDGLTGRMGKREFGSELN